MKRQDPIAQNPGNAMQLAWVDEIYASRLQGGRKGSSRGSHWLLPMARISRHAGPTVF